MFPALPSRISPELEQLIIEVVTASAALGRGVHPLIVGEIARFMEKVNSYYTNAMEGNPSRLRDIEAALNNQFAPDAVARNYQLEHVVHIQVQREMLRRLREEPSLCICSREFISWLHEQFYRQLPQEMRVAKTLSGKFVPMEPGRLRDRGATVGRHDAPEKEADIISCFNAFADTLNPDKLTGHSRALTLI